MGRLRYILICVGVGFCLPTAAVTFAQPPTSRIGSDRDQLQFRDVQLNVYSRRALLQDEKLASLNVGIDIKDGIATLWGPIPSAELGQRAAERVKRVPGISIVRNELHVEIPDIVLPKPLPVNNAMLSPAPTEAELPAKDRRAPGHTLSSPSSVMGPLQRDDSSPRVSISGSASFAVLQPIMPDVPRRTPDSHIRGIAERLKKTDDRFRAVNYTLKDGILTVMSGGRDEDRIRFAEAVARIQGVTKVILEQSQTPANPWHNAELRELRIPTTTSHDDRR